MGVALVLLLLLAAIGYVLLGFWVANQWAGRSRSLVTAFSKFVAVILAFVAIPSGDVIKGRWQFNSLCKNEARVTVLREVAFAEDDLMPNGHLRRARISDGPGFRQMLGTRYILISDERVQVAAWPKIEMSRVQIFEQSSGQLLGEGVNFHYWGGWLAHELSPHVTAESCRQLDKRSLEREVFSNYPIWSPPAVRSILTPSTQPSVPDHTAPVNP